VTSCDTGKHSGREAVIESSLKSLFMKAFPWLLILCLMGCSNSEDGPVRHRVSGRVTFHGKPVPFGSITFDPDVSAGNSGPQGAANIVNGVYDTSSNGGRGVTGGAFLVSLSGLTNPNALEGEDPGILFTDFLIKKELLETATILDIEIPDEAEHRRKNP